MTTKISVQQWINNAIQTLENSETPFLEAQVICASTLGQSREWIIAHSDQELEKEQIEQLNTLVMRLKYGEPLAYLTGQRSFYGLDFKVTPDVLIPRPETELLVEEAATWLDENPHRRKAVDVGTGSGIIAITLADLFPELEMTAVDLSEKALAIARENARTHQLEERIHWQQDDLLSHQNGPFDLILANLPYIPTLTLNQLDVIKFEPRLALDGGANGLMLIERLLSQTVTRLLPGGAIFLEIESTLGETTLTLCQTIFPEARTQLFYDFAHLARVIRIMI
jgi:release factor glutamine methyltransferase